MVTKANEYLLPTPQTWLFDISLNTFNKWKELLQSKALLLALTPLEHCMCLNNPVRHLGEKQGFVL